MNKKSQTYPGNMMPDLYIGTKVVSAEGKEIHSDYRVGHSWTYNGWVFAFGSLCDVPADYRQNISPLGGLFISGKNYVSPSSDDIAPSRSNVSPFAGEGFFNNEPNNSFGLLVGRSDEPFHINDIDLFDLVKHGNSSGQLYYQPQAKPVVSYSSDKFKATHQRIFNNNTTEDIVIKEVGLSMRTNSFATLMTRDVLDAPVTVPPGAQLTVSVDLLSASFAELHSNWKNANSIAPGSYGSGGIFLGGTKTFGAIDNNNSSLYNGMGNHQKYGWVLSPKIGGESGLLKFSSSLPIPGDVLSGDEYYGAPNMDELYALSDCPVADFCAQANASALGGYNDWYIPGYYEMYYILKNISLPPGEEFEDEYYWTLGYYSGSYIYTRNPITGDTTIKYDHDTLRVRLVRKINVQTDWFPDGV